MNCPKCNTANSVTIDRILVAKPIGSFSVAGAQMKVSAVEAAVAECSECDLHVVGRLEGVTYAPDGRTFTGGHFIPDEA